MSPKEILARAEAHMEARWKYLGEMCWQGKVTKKRYFSANRKTVVRNIKWGSVPDGKGFYLRAVP